MGGGAFAQASAPGAPTLRTPRMCPQDYFANKKAYLELLRTHVPDGTVRCTRETPEKTDYGDVDLYIGLDNEHGNFPWETIAQRMGAVGIILHNGGKATLCMPPAAALSPAESSDARLVIYQKHATVGQACSEPPSQRTYVQVDIALVSSALMPWWDFYTSYGDLSSIIGIIVACAGFRMNDRGLFLRLSEYDEYSSNLAPWAGMTVEKSLIFLTDDPRRMLSFFGLSHERFQRGFDTVEDIFRWVSSSILPQAWAARGIGSGRSKRVKTSRPITQRFFREWLPAHIDSKTEREPADGEILRARLAHEAIETFDIRVEYETRKKSLTRAIDNSISSSHLQRILIDNTDLKGNSLTEVARALRRNVGAVVNQDGSVDPYELECPCTDGESLLHKLLDDDRRSLRDGAREWVLLHWEQVRTKERLQRKC